MRVRLGGTGFSAVVQEDGSVYQTYSSARAAAWSCCRSYYPFLDRPRRAERDESDADLELRHDESEQEDV
jgi:hypothetical protein